MNKKITRWSLMNILFAILVSIPLWSIVVRTGYVLLNKNAYQSYSDNNIVEKSTLIARTGNLADNLQYDFILDISKGNTVVQYFYYKEISIDWTEYGAPSSYTYDGFGIYGNSPSSLYVYLRSGGTNVYTFWSAYQTFGSDWQFSMINNGDYTLNGNQAFDIYTFTFQKQKLDNVFDYSIDKFNSENDAHFDFVSDIANMFITEDSYGWRYVEFVNWYFNYFIVISAVYILFLAIIWFVAVSRRLIERSMNLW